MKPVAWITKDGVRCNPLHTFAGPTTVAWEVPLYTADQLREVEQQRDELLAALEDLQGAFDIDEPFAAKARAIIAKVKP